MKTLGEFIGMRLKELGMTQGQLAIKLEMNPSILSRIITGKTTRPSDETLEKLSGQLDCSVEELQRCCSISVSERRSGAAKVLVAESVWALCKVLESVVGKPIEDILRDMLKEAMKGETANE